MHSIYTKQIPTLNVEKDFKIFFNAELRFFNNIFSQISFVKKHCPAIEYSIILTYTLPGSKS